MSGKFTVFIGLAGFMVSMPCFGVISQYSLMVHGKTGQQLHLFSDVHFDVDTMQTTRKQVDDLFAFIQALSSPTVLIVEDIEFERAQEAYSLSFQAPPTFSDRLKQLVNWEPVGIPDLVDTSVLEGLMLYNLIGIPTYNVDKRLASAFNDPYALLNVLLEYEKTDGPMLAQLYQKKYVFIRKEIERALAALAKLQKGTYEEVIKREDLSAHIFGEIVELTIVHYVYQQKDAANSIVVAGQGHIQAVEIIFKDLGYAKKNMISGKAQHGDIFPRMIDTIATLQKLPDRERKRGIGALYKKYIDSISINISKIPRPKPQTVPAPGPRAKL